MMRGRFIDEAPAQANSILEVIERLHPGSLDTLREDPVAELQRWPDVQLRFESETGRGDRCSVAGSYLPDTAPLTLVIGMSNSYRRRGFTALHELGHHLQQTDIGLGQRLFTWQDSEAFEEAACDAVAARVLLPDGDMAGRFDPRGPTALHVVDLFHHSQASREACCVRAAEYLTGGGIVVLLDAAGTVRFAAARGLVPPARGSDQSLTPLISTALRRLGTAEHDATFVAYRNGSSSDALYGQSAWCDEEYLFAVLASDNAAWRPFAPPRPNTSRNRFYTWWTCETCDESFRVSEPPCQRCGEPQCRDGHCGCTTARLEQDRTCDSCFLTLAPSRFEGNSSTCRDCA